MQLSANRLFDALKWEKSAHKEILIPETVSRCQVQAQIFQTETCFDGSCFIEAAY